MSSAKKGGHFASASMSLVDIYLFIAIVYACYKYIINLWARLSGSKLMNRLVRPHPGVYIK